MWSIDADVSPVPKTKICHFAGRSVRPRDFSHEIPSARCNFFKFAPPPPNLKSWIRPWDGTLKKYIIQLWTFYEVNMLYMDLLGLY